LSVMLYVWRDNDVAFVVVSQHVSLQAAVVDVVLDVVENNFHSVYLFCIEALGCLSLCV
jgi:hypothetical protein